MDNCPHKTLKKQLVGNQHWYACEVCKQKFLAEPWDGKVQVENSTKTVASGVQWYESNVLGITHDVKGKK